MPTKRPPARHVAYRALAGELRDAIRRGEFPPGQKLPTEAELAERYELSRHTVRQAFSLLVSEGLVQRSPRRGTFAITPVVEPGPADTFYRAVGSIGDMLVFWQDTDLKVIEPIERASEPEVAERMRLDDDEVLVGTFRRLYDTEPFSVTKVHCPLDLASAFERNESLKTPGRSTPLSITEIVDRSEWGPTERVHKIITATDAPADVARLMECEPGQAVLKVEELHVNRDGDIGILGISHFNPERYSYRVELRRTRQ